MSRIAELEREAYAVFAPPPNITVSEWSDRFRRLSPESSAEPGQWRTDRAPFQRGMMDAFNEPDVAGVVVMSSAQVGKTEFINNVVGYHIDQDPAPILLLQPTLEMAQTWSKDRLAPMLRDTPRLRGKVKDARSRMSNNTMLHKVFPGGHITMSGANSPASLASRPIRIVLCDEVDRYPPSAGTEGDPVNLARKRTTTFWNRKYLLTSTPTVKGVSRIEFAYEESDKRRFFVPCPHCEHKQVLQWSNIHWNKGQPDTACYICESCGARIEEKRKKEMLSQGEWTATEEFTGTAGFHINELYSPWRTWAEIVTDFLEAKKNQETLKTFINTSLGETWEEQGEQPDSTPLMERRENYALVPNEALVLTAGVDVQADRLEVEVVGWGVGFESWGIQEAIFYGDTTRPEPWDDLDLFLSKTFENEDGINLSVACTCIDSGYNTQLVYDFVQNREFRRIYAIKGVPGQGKPLVSAPSRKQTGKIRRKINLFTVGVDGGKGTLYANLKLSDAGPGYCHFPAHYDEEYFQQLTAEKLVTRYKKGRPYLEWEKTRPRNEALDRRVYAMAAVRLINPDFDAIIGKRKGKEKPVEQQKTFGELEKERRKRKIMMPRRKKNFATNY